MFNIGDKLDKANYTQGAIWCNENGCVINPETWVIEEPAKPTQEELENMPCVTLDKIEETDKAYFLHNGEYVCEVPFDQQVEEMRQARANAYEAKVDPLMAEYNRKKTFNLFEEGEEEKLLAEINAKVEEIKQRYPYPVEPIEKNEELPVVEEVVVSKMENIEESEEVI